MSNCFDFSNEVKDLTDRVKKLESHFSGDYQLIASKLNPHKCPVCNGYGKVETPETLRFDILMMSHSMGISACSACNGKGIVWT